jgi:hypothetical protein
VPPLEDVFCPFRFSQLWHQNFKKTKKSEIIPSIQPKRSGLERLKIPLDEEKEVSSNEASRPESSVVANESEAYLLGCLASPQSSISQRTQDVQRPRRSNQSPQQACTPQMGYHPPLVPRWTYYLNVWVMMAPALSSIGHDLHMSDAETNLALSIFVLAFAVGPPCHSTTE